MGDISASKTDISGLLRERLDGAGPEASGLVLELDGRGTGFLKGHAPKWEDVVAIGHAAAKLPGVRNLVCEMTSADMAPAEKPGLAPYAAMGVIDECDVAVIGGGVTGCAIARRLCRHRLDILVLEKEDDLSCGTTKANNGMIHSGYDPKHGSLKARLNVRGNAMYTQWADELGFKMNRTGSFVCGFDEEDRRKIGECYENGVKNGVPGIAVISGGEARAIEPGLSDSITCALWTPSAAYVEPYEVTYALAENAAENGARFLLGHRVVGMEAAGGKIRALLTDRGKIKARHVINAAGLYADDVAEMAGDKFYSIHPRRGTLVIFDKNNKGRITTFSGFAPGAYTKGGGPMETPEGTLIWGPSAIDVPDKEDLAVGKDDLDFVIDKGLRLTKGISRSDVIAYFSGNRASSYNEDFIIENSRELGNFTHVAGIQSPGLASAPAIAELVDGLFTERWGIPEPNPAFDPRLKRPKPFRDCNTAEREAMIARSPLHGRIICRCETVTEAEIVNAIHGKIPALNMDAVKRRTRAGMGRCQRGFCGGRVLEILSRELGIEKTAVEIKGRGTEVLVRDSRGAEGNGGDG